MNAVANPKLSNPDGVKQARLELLRDAIFEQLGFMIHRAELARTFADLSDDAGLTYSLKCMVAHVRAAAQCANDLTALKNGGAE
ncbi:hypothetical protein MPC4_70080 [Methylocella tundrae]|uniref:Uncharacterized protein n=1 Tax=Methylocella tundrae TaxID=227605 RepID=A0A8B6MBB3_METTU|nr:hypothetical protein [Methylocella tundrae]VTZ28460.1 hypothetical protein MPC1_910007 [Methylocella tundrae]VTZ52192.1 hypothetical protein MPC4_70080 [Methylocella tundrae]